MEQTPRLSVDVEFFLTKPVQIQHYADSVLLPHLRSGSQQWSTNAVGGSGVYRWTVEDPNIVSIEDSVMIRSLNVGKTTVTVYDDRNSQNFATITVEVAQISQLSWLEKHMELQGKEADIATRNVTLNVIAQDRLGRKFTNCTSVPMTFNTKREGKITVGEKSPHADFAHLSAYLRENYATVALKNRFDHSPSTIYDSELPEDSWSEEEVLRDNFGICQQTWLVANQEGLGRVRASVDLDDASSIESEFAEIAIYHSL